ncbi:MAG: PHP domain-containing protein [Chloroflexi bacterium]|nr:PHP domain-containing protein [Chloroflexota bacterium]
MAHFKAELHVHTVLSPCAGIEMIPTAIVEEALSRQLNLIAITDHNASANVGAVVQAAQNTDLIVIPGIELETAEEIHLLCLFSTLLELEKFQDVVDRNLPPIQNNEDFFGSQLIVDADGDFIRKDERLLSNATYLSIEAAITLVHKLGGIVIPAHIDREENGILARLGTVPAELQLKTLEYSRYTSPEKMISSYPELSDYRLIQGGDVHYPNDFLGKVELSAVDTRISTILKSLC